jgi:hypothetical protein
MRLGVVADGIDVIPGPLSPECVLEAKRYRDTGDVTKAGRRGCNGVVESKARLAGLISYIFRDGEY